MTHTSAAAVRNVLLAIVLIAISMPAVTHAGVFSTFVELWSSNILTYTAPSTYNSQTIPLPHAAQNIDPNPSKGGGDITIVNDSALLPASGPSGSSADVATDTAIKNNGQISVYIVRPGDTLSGIANMFGVSVNTIRWGNDIARSQSIQPGQELVILPVSGITYTVKRGGTLRDIIKTHGGNLNEAVAYNGYTADEHLGAGVVVIIPDGELSAPKAKISVARSRYIRSTIRPSSRPHNTNGPLYPGYYIRPLVGGVRTQGIHGYNAVDLASRIGTPILASASGKVILSKNGGWNGGYGHYVVISHPNKTQTLYAHLSKSIVFSGQRVVQGQVIGYMGSTGNSTGSHVHFEIRGARNPF